MTLEDLKQKWIAVVDKMNKFGIPVPTARDPKTGKGSITVSLIVFSSGLFGFCILFMLASAIAKWAGFFVLTDATLAQIKTAADYSFQFLLASLGGYLGRKMQKDDSVLQPSPPPKQNQSAPVKHQSRVDDPDSP